MVEGKISRELTANRDLLTKGPFHLTQVSSLAVTGKAPSLYSS